MKKLKLFILTLFSLCLVDKLEAQIDPHFSQYYAYPLWLNPALTGVTDGDVRLNLNAKEQWTGIDNGYKTGGVSVDFRPTDRVGVGFNVINQAAGTAGYNYFAAYGSFGYGIPVSSDGDQKLHFGLQAGVINRSFDPSRMQFDDQYNPIVGFDPNAPSFENFATTSAMVFDASVGAYYYDSSRDRKANLFGGVSVAHLTSPKDPFTEGGIGNRLPLRFTAHGGVLIKASDYIDVTTHAIFIKQQQNQASVLGAYSEFKIQENKGLILGGMYRINDAAIANAGYHIDGLLIGVSYDFNTSAFQAATSGRGGFELSLSYVLGKHQTGPRVVCPKF